MPQPKPQSISRAFGSGKKQSPLKRFMPLVALLLVGGVGAYTLVSTFASTGLVNGYIYTGGGAFVDQTGKTFEHTQGYTTQLNDDPFFSPKGDQVAYFDYKDQTDMDNRVASIVTASSDGTGETSVYRAKAGEIFNYEDISWSRDGNWISFSTDENDPLRFNLYIAHPDGTSLRRLNTDGGNTSTPGESAFSGADSALVHYLAGNQLCSYNIETDQKQCTDLAIDTAINTPELSCGFNQLQSSGSTLFVNRYCNKWPTDWTGNGPKEYTNNIYRIDVSSANAQKLTNYDFQPATGARDDRMIWDFTVSPDGSKLLYVTSVFRYTAENDTSSDQLLESRVYSMSTSGGSQSLFYDNMTTDSYNRINRLSWQPYELGTSQPNIPEALSSDVAIVSPLTLPSLTYGTAAEPKLTITNPNLTSRTYAVTVSRTANGTTAAQSLTVAVLGGTTKDVSLASYTVPYASNGAYVASSANRYSISVKDNKGVSAPTQVKTFGLPMPPFTKTTPAASITKKKGNLATFSGKTLAGKTVSLLNAAKTVVFASGKASSTGAYSFTYKVDKARTTRLCLNGYESATGGCYTVTIAIK